MKGTEEQEVLQTQGLPQKSYDLGCKPLSLVHFCALSQKRGPRTGMIWHFRTTLGQHQGVGIVILWNTLMTLTSALGWFLLTYSGTIFDHSGFEGEMMMVRSWKAPKGGGW